MVGGSERRAVIVEDDLELRRVIEVSLGDAGFSSHSTGSGLDGIELVRVHRPVLTTLDLGLPGIDGLEVIRRIRTFSFTYIIVLSARDEEVDILTSLDAGADDYLTKPFRPRELRARVEAMLRRDRNRAEAGRSPGERDLTSEGVAGSESTSHPGASSESVWLSHNGLRVNPEMRLCELQGEPLALTRSEFVLLVSIMLGERRVISKSSLALDVRGSQHTGGYVSESDERVVESHLAHLRRKLNDSASSPRFIETVRGVGYRLAAPQN